MFILYTTAPLIYRAASSVYYNLSLLSSDFYGLLFGLGLFVSLDHISHANRNTDLSCTKALPTLLALLYRLRRYHRRPRRVLLVLDS